MNSSKLKRSAGGSLAASLFAAAMLSTALPSAVADSEWHPNKGESGWTFVPEHLPKATKTPAEVRKEAQLARDFGRGKISPDGWRYMGGDRGWVYEGHRIEYRNGKWVHVDGIDKSATKPSPAMTAKEREKFNALYGGGG